MLNTDYDALLRGIEAVTAGNSEDVLHVALWFDPKGVRTCSEFFLDPLQAHVVARPHGVPYVLVRGTETLLNRMLREATQASSGLAGLDDVLAVLRVLNESDYSNQLDVTGFNHSVTALAPPAAKRYPANLPEDRRVVWDSVMESQTFQDASRGASAEAKWAIATRLYGNRCARLGVSPFQSGAYTRTEMNREYQEIFKRANSLEFVLRNNLIEDKALSSIGLNSPWRYVECGYNNRNFVLVLERVWHMYTPGPELLARLIDHEGFKRNNHGAGYIHPIDRRSMLRIRIKRGATQAQVQLFLMFTKDKLTQALGIPPKATVDQILDRFEPLAQNWYQKRRF